MILFFKPFMGIESKVERVLFNLLVPTFKLSNGFPATPSGPCNISKTCFLSGLHPYPSICILVISSLNNICSPFLKGESTIVSNNAFLVFTASNTLGKNCSPSALIEIELLYLPFTEKVCLSPFEKETVL